MYLYLFKIDCYSEDDILNLKQDDLNILMSNPGNKGSWYSISTESTDFDKWDISFDKMSISPADTSEDLKCSYDEAEENYTFLVALKSDEILCEPSMISNVNKVIITPHRFVISTQYSIVNLLRAWVED